MKYAALVTWVVAAALGFTMLTTWVRHGGTRAAEGPGSHFRPPVVFSHFGLAASGLVVWLVYVVNDSSALAWIAFIDLVVVAAIGDTLVYRWYRDRAAAVGGAAAAAGGPGAAVGGTLAEQRIPTSLVAAHGVFAVATLVLVLLAALEVGGS